MKVIIDDIYYFPRAVQKSLSISCNHKPAVVVWQIVNIRGKI